VRPGPRRAAATPSAASDSSGATGASAGGASVGDAAGHTENVRTFMPVTRANDVPHGVPRRPPSDVFRGGTGAFRRGATDVQSGIENFFARR
jgi:hypothetical protein